MKKPIDKLPSVKHRKRGRLIVCEKCGKIGGTLVKNDGGYIHERCVR